MPDSRSRGKQWAIDQRFAESLTGRLEPLLEPEWQDTPARYEIGRK